MRTQCRLRVPVVVDVDAIDRLGVEIPGLSLNGFTSRISTVWPAPSGEREDEQIGQVQRASSPGNLSMAALKMNSTPSPPLVVRPSTRKAARRVHASAIRCLQGAYENPPKVVVASACRARGHP